MRVLFRDENNILMAAEADQVITKPDMEDMICVRLSGIGESGQPEYIIRPLLGDMNYEQLVRTAYATGKLDLSEIQCDRRLLDLYDQFDAMYED